MAFNGSALQGVLNDRRIWYSGVDRLYRHRGASRLVLQCYGPTCAKSLHSTQRACLGTILVAETPRFGTTSRLLYEVFVCELLNPRFRQ